MTTVPVLKRADQLVVGDRILNKYLPSPFSPDPGEVVFVRLHEYRTARWVFVAYRLPDGFYDSTAYLPEGAVETFPADTGLGYSRADDGEVTQPIAGRVPAHFGAVEVAGGLVDIEQPSHLFGLDAGEMGAHSGGCAWPDVQCIGHPSAD